jgi:hypothetical protein
VIVQLDDAITVHEALPGNARATYVVAASAFCHDTIAPPFVGVAVNCWMRTDDAGTYNNRLFVCGFRPLLKYVIAFVVELSRNHVHAAVGPVAKFVGPVSNSCKNRVIAPEINGAAIEVPDCVAYVLAVPERYGKADLIDEPGEKISTHNP